MSAGGEHLKDEGTKRQVVLAGGTAGLISRFCIAPLDVVKIRLQLQIHSLSDPASHRTVVGPVYKGTLSTMGNIVRQEGIAGLWKGNIPAEMMYVCYGALQFTVYRATTQALAELGPYRLPPSAESFAAGAVAGGIATATTYPLDLLRTRFAAQGTDRIYGSLRASVVEIARQEGPAGFFRGCSAAVAQIVPYMGLFFTAYEGFRPTMSKWESLPFGTGDAAAGVLASVIAKTGVFPLDLVRKRLQVQGPTRTRYVHRNIPEYNGVVRSISLILKTQGVRGLYRGLTVSLLKAAPASAVTMWTYERVLRLLQEMDLAALS
ncbi:Mitochondrial thiamine pyrophosphate carrier 1 [Penicillium macrosclerotiorum]|uniref:Mitochondrial thiamine pyrophosphate carrier 1 n=1 Tax=Penicillium macrosclerotiorum TaxID=303699 RepID=UPI002547264E|nr:Mitochondrial thiamine pyrophosphate carrier 1 [Penicillium macrosclerotiorum]KAJ5698778.1 Mitochondrial thiamine pyrophosphate carrier 1 [Penicillium macrosclerotiorum]